MSRSRPSGPPASPSSASSTRDASDAPAGPARPSRGRAWWLAARPKTLWAAVAPVAVGTGCAVGLGCARPGPAIAALGGALLLQIGTNFANDLFDHRSGADSAERVGPARAVAQGWIPPRAMALATAAAFAAATLCGAYLVWVAGPWIAVVGVASIVAGIAYTGGPFPLGYHGLGDVFVFLFFGVVAVVGTAFVQCGQAPASAWWASAPVGALATAILAVNNLRDRHTDAVAGKRTLAVRWGGGAVRAEIALLVVGSYLAVAGMAWRWGSAVLLLPWLSAPLAALALGRIARREGAALNASLAETSRLLLVFSLLLAAALALVR